MLEQVKVALTERGRALDQLEVMRGHKRVLKKEVRFDASDPPTYPRRPVVALKIIRRCCCCARRQRARVLRRRRCSDS